MRTDPAMLGGPLAPINGIVMMIGGIPAPAYSMAGSIVFPTIIGEDTQLIEENSGRFLSSSLSPTTEAAIRISRSASSFLYTPPLTMCLQVFRTDAANSYAV